MSTSDITVHLQDRFFFFYFYEWSRHWFIFSNDIYRDWQNGWWFQTLFLHVLRSCNKSWEHVRWLVERSGRLQTQIIIFFVDQGTSTVESNLDNGWQRRWLPKHYRKEILGPSLEKATRRAMMQATGRLWQWWQAEVSDNGDLWKQATIATSGASDDRLA